MLYAISQNAKNNIVCNDQRHVDTTYLLSTFVNQLNDNRELKECHSFTVTAEFNVSLTLLFTGIEPSQTNDPILLL